ncbi:MAG: hypothetical protein HY696_06665 [Deltaproteobacteria bacterium]|nr:hypothetical protein [Deltaproteobacteria bacterium]
MGDGRLKTQATVDFPGSCVPFVGTHDREWRCILEADGPVALVNADPRQTMVMTDTGAATVPACLYYDPAMQRIRWQATAACYAALSPRMAARRAHDARAAAELGAAIDVTRHRGNVVQHFLAHKPATAAWLVQVAERPEVDLPPAFIAAIVSIETKWMLNPPQNRLGLGQVEPLTRRAIVASDEFQQAWRGLHGNHAVPVPEPAESVLCELLVVGIRLARIRTQDDVPIPHFGDPHDVPLPVQVRIAQAARVLYGYPGLPTVARNVLAWGAGAAIGVDGVRAGFADRLDAFGHITHRWLRDFQDVGEADAAGSVTSRSE